MNKTQLVIFELIAGGGSALVAYGAWLIYPPAGFIVAGILIVGVSVMGVLSARPE